MMRPNHDVGIGVVVKQTGVTVTGFLNGLNLFRRSTMNGLLTSFLRPMRWLYVSCNHSLASEAPNRQDLVVG